MVIIGMLPEMLAPRYVAKVKFQTQVCKFHVYGNSNSWFAGTIGQSSSSVRPLLSENGPKSIVGVPGKDEVQVFSKACQLDWGHSKLMFVLMWPWRGPPRFQNSQGILISGLSRADTKRCQRT